MWRRLPVVHRAHRAWLFGQNKIRGEMMRGGGCNWGGACRGEEGRKRRESAEIKPKKGSEEMQRDKESGEREAGESVCSCITAIEWLKS